MALPHVNIKFMNGTVGGVDAIDDGVTLMVLEDYEGDDLDVLNIEDYRAKLGEDDTEQPEVVAFYNEVGGNTRLIITGGEQTEATLKAKLSQYQGEVKLVLINEVADLTAAKMYNTVAEWATTTLYAPILVLIQANDTFIGNVTDFKTLNLAHLAVVDNVNDINGTPLLYYAGGRLARNQVHRSIAAVRDGAIYATELYHGDSLIDNLYAEPKHNKGLITARVYVGKSGFYFSDDLMAMAATDDYALIPRRRTIDKAYRIAYKTLVDYLGAQLPVTKAGTIPVATCKDIETTVERAIYADMTVNGNLGTDSSDSDDTGVTCFINPEQDVVRTSKLEVTLKVRPYGYIKDIEVALGFSTEA